MHDKGIKDMSNEKRHISSLTAFPGVSETSEKILKCEDSILRHNNIKGIKINYNSIMYDYSSLSILIT